MDSNGPSVSTNRTPGSMRTCKFSMLSSSLARYPSMNDRNEGELDKSIPIEEKCC